MPFCVRCHQFIEPKLCLCNLCHRDLWNALFEHPYSFYLPAASTTRDPRGHQAWAVAPYEGLTRELILNIKRHGCMRSLSALLQFCEKKLAALMGSQTWHGIIPAPPSVRSRLRCQIDIARELATRLGKSYGAPVISAPQKLHWRFQKRGKQKNKFWRPSDISMRNFKDSFIWNHRGSTPHILLVDDVITSGFTMASLAGQYVGAEISTIACCVSMHLKS